MLRQGILGHFHFCFQPIWAVMITIRWASDWKKRRVPFCAGTEGDGMDANGSTSLSGGQKNWMGGLPSSLMVMPHPIETCSRYFWLPFLQQFLKAVTNGQTAELRERPGCAFKNYSESNPAVTLFGVEVVQGSLV